MTVCVRGSVGFNQCALFNQQSFIDLDDRFNALTMTSHLKTSSDFREVTLTFYSFNILFDIFIYN